MTNDYIKFTTDLEIFQTLMSELYTKSTNKAKIEKIYKIAEQLIELKDKE